MIVNHHVFKFQITVTELFLVEVIDGAKHLLEIKPHFFQLKVVLNWGNIIEKLATRDIFQNYVSAGSLIVKLIKHLKTVWVVMEHSNEVWVSIILSYQTQKFIDRNLIIESSTCRIVFKNFDCNSSFLIVSSVPTFGLSATTQFIGACESSINNVCTPQLPFFW